MPCLPDIAAHRAPEVHRELRLGVVHSDAIRKDKSADHVHWREPSSTCVAKAICLLPESTGTNIMVVRARRVLTEENL
jgi:hypothetical protein